jgi:F1F0 ATPase subunit 2
MNEHLILVLMGVAGVLLGVFFFGGLWYTVRRGLGSKRPGLWFLVSLLLRTGVVVAGFYFISDGGWKGLLACLVGFVVGRLVVTRLAGPPIEDHHSAVKESAHAP